MHFKVSLGSELVQAFRFTHYAKKAAVYTVKVERTTGGSATDFKPEPATINAAAADSYNGIELSVNVRFDPNKYGWPW